MKDQCVCISGSTHGIGYGMAEAFAKKGARIVINSHLDDNGALEKLSKLTECHYVKSDLSTVTGAEYLVEKSFELLGSLDTLINNDYNAHITVLGMGKKWTGFRMKNELIYI